MVAKQAVHACWLFSLVVMVGCGAGLRVSLVDSAYQQPSNVAVFFSVDDARGDPVGGLQANDFRVYEDGQLVSVDESKQTIVNQEVAAEHYTLLLVDMSGSVTESDQLPLIEEAAAQFTSSLERDQKVAVYAFDGSEEIHEIRGFRQGRPGRITGFRAKDPSTNLHGAVVAGIKVLTEALDESKAPLRFGTLVVFTDGTDRAARVSRGDMGDRIDDAGFDIFAIGVGNEIDEGTLGDVGRNGYVRVEDSSALAQAFEAISARILAYKQRYYLLSYCSPARAGKHEVTVEAVHESASGKLSYEFDAEGFGPQCNPEAPPPFATGKRRTQPLPTPERGTRIELRQSSTPTQESGL
jgi:hypothetical protein